jgi:hypothetical protein
MTDNKDRCYIEIQRIADQFDSRGRETVLATGPDAVSIMIGDLTKTYLATLAELPANPLLLQYNHMTLYAIIGLTHSYISAANYLKDMKDEADQN